MLGEGRLGSVQERVTAEVEFRRLLQHFSKRRSKKESRAPATE